MFSFDLERNMWRQVARIGFLSKAEINFLKVKNAKLDLSGGGYYAGVIGIGLGLLKETFDIK